jgi:NAD(P)-dependent dehydrogenase (short-subunit alcohol dehydrogenase family)
MESLARKAVLVTRADRGLGRALVDQALSREAASVVAGTLQPLAHPDPRVAPIPLDVTDEMQVSRGSQTGRTG